MLILTEDGIIAARDKWGRTPIAVSYTHLNTILSVNNAGSVTLASAIQNAINIPNKIICFFISAKFVVLLSL